MEPAGTAADFWRHTYVMSTLRAAFLAAVLLASQSTAAAITGVLMTNAGDPVGGADVQLHEVELTHDERARLLSDAPIRQPLVSARTDSKGTFTLASPERGVYEVSIVAP